MNPSVRIIAILVLFIYMLSFMTAICCYFPVFRHIFFAGMLYFTTNNCSVSIYPIPLWRGTERGYTFTAVSLFAVPLLMSMILSMKYKVRLFPPGFFFYFLYFLAILVSGINAVHVHQWGFEVCKMFWMYVTFLAAFNYLYNCKDLTFFVYIVCSILIILFLVGLDQKYRLGKYQVRATFAHQNSLSLYLEQYGLLLLGILMNEKMSRRLFLLSLLAFGGSVLLIIFTYSRGGLVVYFGGIAIVCAVSILLNGFSVRRLILMLVGMLVVLSIVGYALPRIIQRFTKAPEQSKNTRIGLAIAAKRIANDYTLGVGANNFSEYSGTKHNYSTTEFFTPKNETSGLVETIYLLVAAECGWWGLGALIMWFLYYYFSAIISMFVLRKRPCNGFMIGAFAGLTCNYWHSTLEWSLKQPNNFAGQMIFYAMIAVIAVHRKNIVTAYRRMTAQEKEPVRISTGLSPVPALLPDAPPEPEPEPGPESATIFSEPPYEKQPV